MINDPGYWLIHGFGYQLRWLFNEMFWLSNIIINNNNNNNNKYNNNT